MINILLSGYQFEWYRAKAKAKVWCHKVSLSFPWQETVSRIEQVILLLVRDWLQDLKASNMKKRGDKQPADDGAMRPEYDFSGGKRGATARRFEQGTNLAIIAPEVLDVFPDSEAVNEVLRALAPVVRSRRSSSS